MKTETLISRAIGDVQTKDGIIKKVQKNGFTLIYSVSNDRFIVTCVSPKGKVLRCNNKHPKTSNHSYNTWLDMINKAPKDWAEKKQCKLRSGVIATVLATNPKLAEYLTRYKRRAFNHIIK